VRIPPRTATDSYLAKMRTQLDIVFDVDLGELVRGHHVVARGIILGRRLRMHRIDRERLRELMEGADDPNNGGGFISRRRPAGSDTAKPDAGIPDAGEPDDEVRVTEPELHYEFVPGLDGGEGQHGFDWYWMMYASDDVGTEYADYNGGAFDPDSGGTASHGTRDIGGQIPPEASRLTLRFEPPEDWVPPEPWRHEIVIDLRERRLAR
jgi:hypothetical protein